MFIWLKWRHFLPRFGLPFSIWGFLYTPNTGLLWWDVWKGRPSEPLARCAVFLTTQTCFAALVMAGNMVLVIMQSLLVILLQFMYLLLLAKLGFAFDSLWSIKGHVVLRSRRAVLVTASWPNFTNVVSLSTPCGITWRGCSSSLCALKWHWRLLWSAK